MRPPGASLDAIVVGSGFGGAFVAHALVEAGARVVMLERGAWVERGPHNWGPQGSIELSPYYSRDTIYRVVAGAAKAQIATYSCVGGPSVFFGGVTLRFREGDFDPPPEIVGDSGARWPFGYDELAPWYDRAESLLGVAGEMNGGGPTEPPRSGPFPQPAAPLSGTSRMIADAGRALGLQPARLPLAIQHTAVDGRNACVACGTCDTFACAISAKNDLATTILPRLMAKGMVLKPRTLVARLVTRNGRVTGVETIDKETGTREQLTADLVVAAAGALGSPHVLLASGLASRSPAGDAVGRYLTRHCSAIQFGIFPRLPDGRTFHKQIGFFDYYYGDPTAPEGGRKLGCLQQVQSPSPDLVRGYLPTLVGLGVTPILSHLTGLLAMAEDEPRRENGVRVEPGRTDRYGLPELQVEHRYTARDLAARDTLMARARQILRQAGAFFYKKHLIWTFSHAAGTVRMGDDARSAPLDRFCRFRGVDGLYVVDASFMPTGAGVNPSLTIAANALRVGDAIVRGERPA